MLCVERFQAKCRRVPTSSRRTARTRRVTTASIRDELSKNPISRHRVVHTFTATLTHVFFATAFQTLSASADPVDFVSIKEADFTGPGSYKPSRLPRLEHTCAKCFPLCVGDRSLKSDRILLFHCLDLRCLVRIQVTYPKAKEKEAQPPYPLAIISSGFLVKAEEYASYAERLATWGYVAVLYDKIENLMESLDDVVSFNVIRDIIDWAQQDPLMQKISDADCVYLIGHSRGGKLSVLAAAEDSRVRSLCLIDPVDNTIYAPLGPGYPSAVAAIESHDVSIPMLAIGSELGADCAPIESNYQKFYDAAKGPAMEIVIRGSGHFQFLDQPTNLDFAICAQGDTEDAEVRKIAQSFMVAWGESTLKKYPRQVVEERYRPRSTTRRDLASRRRSLTTKQPEKAQTPTEPYKHVADLLNNTVHISHRHKNFSSSV